MTPVKWPIVLLTGPTPGLIPRLPVSSDLSCYETALFDFRSHRFDVDAVALARLTGCSLVACRQQLFMAEGDMGLAHELLVCGYDLESCGPTFH